MFRPAVDERTSKDSMSGTSRLVNATLKVVWGDELALPSGGHDLDGDVGRPGIASCYAGLYLPRDICDEPRRPRPSRPSFASFVRCSCWHRSPSWSVHRRLRCLSRRRTIPLMAEDEQQPDLVEELFAPLPRTAMVSAVQAILGVTHHQAHQIVAAFDEFVSAPLEANLKKLHGRDLAKRNPVSYTARGIHTVDDWVTQVLADKETSAIENHIGTFMEEVARIVSGGIKPGSGVDLQIERPGTPPVTELYAIQAAPNTKSAGGSRSDVDSLRRAAGALRAGRRVVEQYVAVLHGRKKTAALGTDPNITKLASDEFWEKVSGIPDFRARLLEASTVLAALLAGRAAKEVARVKTEAAAVFGDAQGNLRLDVLASPPSGRQVRPKSDPS